MRLFKVWVLLIGCYSLPSGLSAADEPASGTTGLVDRIVAIVNDDVVLLSELNREIAELLRKIKDSDTPNPPESILQKQALEKLILLKIQLAQAKKIGISTDDETITKAISNIADRNGLTVEELQDALAADGMVFQDFRNKLGNEIVLNRLKNREVLNKIQVSKAEVDSYLFQEQNSGGRSAFKLLHILIAIPDAPSPKQIHAARDKARMLIKKIQQGADFRVVAQNSSDGRQAIKGGDLGWLSKDEVPSLFIKVASQLERGAVAGPLQSSSGFHLIQLEDYRGGDRSIVNQTHARHILIRTNEVTSDQDAQTRLTQLRQRIIGGDDFETLARSHSNDQGSAIKGGDLGWVNAGDLVPAFEEVMDSLDQNQISEPFRTQFGWHMVQVLSRRNHDATDEVQRTKAREVIKNRKAVEAGDLYIRRLRDEAYIEIRLEDDF